MCWIGVSVDKRYGDRLDTELTEASGDGADCSFIERPPHGPVHIHAFRHGAAQLARSCLNNVDVVLVEAALVGDLDHVAKAVRGNERGTRSLALDDGVGGK